MSGWSPRVTAVVALLVTLIAVGLFVGFVKRGMAAERGFVIETAANDPPKPAAIPTPVPTSPPAEVVVHVAGEVAKPGVYRLPQGARAEDAIKAAGGAKPDANQDAVNLAAAVEDGQQLYLPSRKERPEGGAAPASSSAKPGARQGHAGTASAIAKLHKPGSGTVNINTASSAELQRLPGVGPAMAERILAYRKEIGRFTSPDQLMDVSGIGEKKLARMQPFVRVK
jgi:competence protein ComEA